RGGTVVLEAERLQHGGEVPPLDVLQMESVAVDEPAVAEREDLHRGAIALGGDPDHVDGADRAPVRRLPLCEVTDGKQPVPVTRGFLEPLPDRRLLHAALELALDRPRLAGEELDHAVEDLRGRLLADVARARRL